MIQSWKRTSHAFATWLTHTLGLTSPSWRILCAVACVCSLAATIATQLHTRSSYDEHITIAQGVRATLEGLEMGITCGYIDHHEATSQYLKCVERASFIEAPR
jgi:hypothetical protein